MVTDASLVTPFSSCRPAADDGRQLDRLEVSGGPSTVTLTR
jgi:hypothetical protein